MYDTYVKLAVNPDVCGLFP